jgi:diaminopimelate epimerase
MASRVLHDYAKYHGLGNDYLVLDPVRFTVRAAMNGTGLPADTVKLLCDRNRGVGADGVLWGPLRTQDGTAGLRIFNPDGSEAEKSGNGLRIFARYLWDQGYITRREPFPILTPGGKSIAEVKDERGSVISVAVGRASFNSVDVPMLGAPRDVVEESLEVAGEYVTVCCVNVGNPHCVVTDRNPSPALAQRLGPLIERLPVFPNRINVQFMRAKDRRSIEIQIWERGAGYTLASGTSACAAASAAVRMGIAEWPVAVHMPGGTLTVGNLPQVGLVLTGPVAAVGTGDFAPELMTQLHLARTSGLAAVVPLKIAPAPKPKPVKVAKPAKPKKPAGKAVAKKKPVIKAKLAKAKKPAKKAAKGKKRR